MPVATIRNLLVIVLVVCIDGALLHDCLADHAYFPYFDWPMLFRFVFAGSVPMLSVVLIVGAMALPGRGRGRPSLIGFALAGAVAIFSLMGLALVVPWEWFIPWYADLNRSLISWYYKHRPGMEFKDFHLAVDMTLFTALFTPPELLIAVLGGFLARRHSRRLAATRIPTRTPRPADATITRP